MYGSTVATTSDEMKENGIDEEWANSDGDMRVTVIDINTRIVEFDLFT